MYREVPKERLVHTYFSESFYQKYAERAESALHGAADSASGGAAGNETAGMMQNVTILSDRVFESVSDTKTPQGVLCTVRQYHYGLPALLRGRPLLMALENIQDPGNLGTILRTAEGAGVTGVLLSPGCADIYNPKVIRSTMGSVYRMPFHYAANWEKALKELKKAGVTLYAAHLKGAKPYDCCDYRGPSAFLIGNESRGLTEETVSLADTCIRIPMCGRVESLNAAVASAILMYEAGRQRRGR